MFGRGGEDLGFLPRGAEADSQWSTPLSGQFSFFSQQVQSSTISTLQFDPYEELLWSGNVMGRVASYYSPNLDKYTGFTVCNTDVRALDVGEEHVLSLSDNALHVHRKQGLLLYNFSNEKMQSLHALHRMAPSVVLIGGEDDKLLQIDIETKKEMRSIRLKEKNAMLIRSNVSFVVTGDSEGKVALRDPRTLETTHTLVAHAGPLVDCDVLGNRLITCGCSPRNNSFHGDPYVKVYDIRTLQSLAPVPLSFGPLFARFIPSITHSTLAIVSQIGQLQICDLNGRGAGLASHIDQAMYSLFAFSPSPSGNCLAFGDEAGQLHLYSDVPSPVFHNDPWPTDFADPLPPLPQSFPIDDVNTPLSIIPLPFSSDDGYLSDWPEELCVKAYREQTPLPEYPSLRMAQFVGYAPNPRAGTPLKAFNVCPYVMDRRREPGSAASSVSPRATSSEKESGPPVIPRFYRRVAVKKSRFGNDDVDFVRYNKTRHVALEAHPHALYLNAIVSAMYHVVGLRNVFLCHLCEEEHCLVCQTGFLFRMLSDRSTRQPATSNNLVRSLRNFKEEDLIVAVEKSSSDLLVRAQKAFSFILEHCHRKLQSLDVEEAKELASTCEIIYDLNKRCIRCGEVFTAEDRSLVLSFNYPAAGVEKLSFCTLIEKSLNSRGQVEEECAKCKTKARIEVVRRVNGQLPSLLLLDTNSSHPHFLPFWTSQLQQSERRPPYRMPGEEVEGEHEVRLAVGKPCRYGDECRKPMCQFIHPRDKRETPGVQSGDSPKRTGEWSHYVPLKIFAKAQKGIAIVRERKAEEDAKCFSLYAMVLGIGEEGAGSGGATHLLTALSSPDLDSKDKSWAIFNEFIVTRVTEHEAIHLDSRWKLPVLFFYLEEESALARLVERRREIPHSVFLSDKNLAGAGPLRAEVQLPEKGEVVGIDAEFIDVAREGRKSVGRVSVVTEDGRLIVDDYVTTSDADIVHDYLTPFSGIEESDLDPSRSTKHLTTLKNVYLKILHLIERGVVFVGHALNNDFSVLNIFVPEEQMKDTVQLFHLPQQRMISLQFLAWHLLGEKIQEVTHDSVEDACTALRLYTKYQELEREGKLKEVIHELYETGKKTNWRLQSPSKDVSVVDESKESKETNEEDNESESPPAASQPEVEETKSQETPQ